MSRFALYFASGESLYFGAALLLLALVTPTKRTWITRARNVLAWVAVVFMVMACPPFDLIVDLSFLALFVIWVITSNRLSPSQRFIGLQSGSKVLLAISLVVLSAIEFSHRTLPTITGVASDHLVVIGDSISSGIDPRLETWPVILQQTCGLQVRNLARPGAQVSEGLLVARGLTDGDHLVLIKIGGNDLLMGVSADEYGKDLDALLSNLVAPNRTVIMFELPLFPNKIAYGH
jgi:hypothetical protein